MLDVLVLVYAHVFSPYQPWHTHLNHLNTPRSTSLYFAIHPYTPFPHHVHPIYTHFYTPITHSVITFRYYFPLFQPFHYGRVRWHAAGVVTVTAERTSDASVQWHGTGEVLLSVSLYMNDSMNVNVNVRGVLNNVCLEYCGEAHASSHTVPSFPLPFPPFPSLSPPFSSFPCVLSPRILHPRQVLLARPDKAILAGLGTGAWQHMYLFIVYSMGTSHVLFSVLPSPPLPLSPSLPRVSLCPPLSGRRIHSCEIYILTSIGTNIEEECTY